MRIADSHLHIFRNGYPGLYGRQLLASDIDVYESFRKIHDIAAGLIVGYEAEGIDPNNNAHIRSLAVDHSWMITLAYVSPQSSPSAQSIAALLADGHAGIAVYIASDQDSAAALAWPASAWGELDAGKAIISLNILPEHTQTIASLAKNYRNCTWLASHLGLPGTFAKPPSSSEATARLQSLFEIAPFGNVMVKVSGLYAISDPSFDYPHNSANPFIDLAIEHFGVERCLWGSDYSPALDHVSFAQTVAIPQLDRLGRAEREAIMGGNLLKLISSRT